MIKVVEVSGSEPLVVAKYEAFCRAYVKNGQIGKEAAISAGYSKKTAQEQSSRLLSNVIIQEGIQKNMDKRAEKTEITAEMVIKELAKLAFIDAKKLFSDSGRLLPITELPDDVSGAIASV